MDFRRSRENYEPFGIEIAGCGVSENGNAVVNADNLKAITHGSKCGQVPRLPVATLSDNSDSQFHSNKPMAVVGSDRLSLAAFAFGDSLADFVTWIALANHVNSTTAANHLAVRMAIF